MEVRGQETSAQQKGFSSIFLVDFVSFVAKTLLRFVPADLCASE